MANLPKPGEVDADNIARPTANELSAEDRQCYEELLQEEEMERARKKFEDKTQWYLSHFSKDRKGAVSKDKEVVMVTDEKEDDKSTTSVTYPSAPITYDQMQNLLLIGQKQTITICQGLIEKTLGKQSTTMNGSDMNSDLVGVSNSSATIPPKDPQFGMPMSYSTQGTPGQFGQPAPVIPVLGTGPIGPSTSQQYGQTPVRPVPGTGPTGSGAMVMYQHVPEPLAVVPHVQANYGRTNAGFGYVPPHNTLTNNTYPMPSQGSVYLQQSYVQPIRISQQSPNDGEPSWMADPYLKGLFDDYKRDLANMTKDTFGVEVKDKTLACQKPYPESFDSLPYPHGFKVPEFVKFTGEDNRTTWEHVSQFNAELGVHGRVDHLKIRLFPLSLSSDGTRYSRKASPSGIWNLPASSLHMMLSVSGAPPPPAIPRHPPLSTSDRPVTLVLL